MGAMGDMAAQRRGAYERYRMTEVDSMPHRLAAIQARIKAACERGARPPESVALLPVSKTFPVEAIRHAAALGLRRFGENKTQEIRHKAPELADLDLQWVMIGHLQTNKAKDVARDVAEVQSLDRLELADALQRRLEMEARSLDVLVQVKTSPEPSKYGLAPELLPGFLRTLVSDFPALRVQGLMTMAVNDEDPQAVRACFRLLRELRDRARDSVPGVALDRLSMGMSGDFEIAIEEGSTEIRIGSALFGARPASAP
ncbi:pyridoxal phosphate enzyme, YggS family [Bordetella bronchiseptica CA90 BB1334]|nr:pyridoxal phosphate enzyme, YggS family [Bordetella bronchiseptica MO211]KAK74941.1 pyridoxal phosphate enzyme, YggS family [Bordetella bronchiseptica CA90 BB02]KCV35910.1 pyridoxal phosphate enzyme, YggS family [Bordetella bronchiseptica 00-P-2730]KDB78787.1 pyridoxal phosphate enzyme, YggS family [Bordetella bronchiseptica CA90 BB1334]KDC30351.1 pyridoxal phosphate enzyme, YggS family [Bordetella bronchiseptica F2]KDC31056.1 pyridoxal phosphate enzyme, YggS family [Bordetella bronchisepti